MEPKGSFIQRFCPLKKKSRSGVGDRAGGDVLNSCIRQVIRPLRIFQFLTVVLIFILITYTINLASHDLSSITCILILALSGIYVFILALDLICQFGGGEMHTLPMFMFSLLGTIFFACAGIMLLFTYTSPWAIMTIACLSLVAFILFVIDVTLILAFWKRSCNVCQECCYAKTTEVLYQATGDCDPACTEPVKYDLMTSVSSVRVPSGDEQVTPDHSMRKVNFGHRREYVDCKTSARTLANTGVRDVQTEKRPVVDVQSQTPREVKEMPVQTISRCEMCNRKINLSSKSSGTIPAAHQACAPCPALVQLFRGHPCSPGCRCNVTGIIAQVSQQNQQAQTQQQREARSKPDPNHWTQPADQNAYDMLPSEADSSKLTEVSGTITKVTLASYTVPPKRTSTSSQTGEAEEIIEKVDESDNPKNSKVLQRRNEVKKKHEVMIPEKDNKGAERREATNDRKLHSGRNARPMKSPKVQSDAAKEEINNSEKKEVAFCCEETGDNENKEENKNPNKNENNNPNKNENKNPNNKNDNVDEKGNEDRAIAMVARQMMRPSGDESEITLSLSGQTISSMQLGKIESKRIIHPTKQVAEMMDRLQEIEEADSAVRSPDASIIISPSAKKMDLHDKRPSVEQRKRIKDTRSVVAVQSGEKRRPKDSVSSIRTKQDLSDSDISAESEMSIMEVTEKEDVVEMFKGKHKPESLHIPEVPETKPEIAKEPSGLDVQSMVSTTSSKSKRSYGFRRKNKIEPSDVSDMDVQPLDTSAAYCAEKLEEEKLLAEERDTFDEKGSNLCPVCKKIQLPVTSSYQYSNVYRDKRGRIYCENCATSNTVKTHYKREPDQKRLKCWICGNFLRIKTHQSARNRPGNCPHCGQTQVARTESPASA